VVICYSNKDYEVSSWNEQGEITRIEGMLTIAFFISVCSHRDRKQLYLVMKIPYLVNMSSEDENINLGKKIASINLNNKEELVEEVPKLTKKIYDLEIENKILKEKIEELTKKYDELLLDTTNTAVENKKLSKEILRLKIISGEAKSGWRQDQDMVERDNPETGELEFYKCPINFMHSAVQDKTYLDKRRLKVRFYHDVGDPHDRTWFEMPTDAYLWLCGELPEQQKGKTKPRNDLKIDTPEQMKTYLDGCEIIYQKKKIDYRSLDHLDSVINFILKNKGKKFETKDFRRENNDIQSETTISKYLAILEICKILHKHHSGVWEVCIQ